MQNLETRPFDYDKNLDKWLFALEIAIAAVFLGGVAAGVLYGVIMTVITLVWRRFDPTIPFSSTMTSAGLVHAFGKR